MLFNTLRFFIFFAIVYGLYLLLDRKKQNILLLLASYVFYCFWDWRFLGLILLSTGFNYVLGLRIGEAGTQRKKRFFLILSLCCNLGMLGFFKYYDFFIQGLSGLLSLIGLNTGPLTLNIILPLGISFYTFQAMSYPIDIYRGVIKPTRKPVDFGLFIAFFPQLVAGPIERARNLLPQFARKRDITPEKFYEGCWLIFWGLFKKIVVADTLARFTGSVFGSGGIYPGGQALVSTWLYALQVYVDFSGYSNMARGLARVMGIDLMTNFKTPFFSKNLYDLWQRWHISLTTWIKEYVYYPIALTSYGGKRLPASLSIIITWAIMGFWHGAAWTFILWGVYHGVLLVAYNKIRPRLKHFEPRRPAAVSALNALKMFTVFNLFSLGILFFALKEAVNVWTVTTRIFKDLFSWNWSALNGQLLSFLALLLLPVAILEYFQYRTGNEYVIFRLPVPARVAVYIFLVYLMINYGDFNAQKYYYFQF
ncbi:MAG: MBOAT family protein [Candidatus Omnitrophica bacterium]|nr:MBOAT family protein [Candidatus Omnitrophota bacterium]